MPDTRKQLGDFGEQVALGYLLRLGMREITRKWRCRAGEIDLVMRDGTTLVFAEVRTRRDGNAAESVDARKQARLARLAYSYLAAHDMPNDMLWRIDVVAIAIGRSGRADKIEHIRSAVSEG